MAQLTRRAALAGATGVAVTAADPAKAQPPSAQKAIARKIEVFGHRGCSALRPEHTLASYAKAIADGADYVEPDLCLSKDGAFVIRHEPEISETTDILAHPEFAARKTTRTIDGHPVTGFFTCDFTLAELKTLRAKERLPKVRPQNAAYDGEFQLVTFEEYLDFIAAESAARGRMIGLVPELKHSTWHASIGLPMEDRFLSVLDAHSYASRAPLEVQSFETDNLRYLRRKMGRRPNLRLMALVDDSAARPGDSLAKGSPTTFADLITASGLKEMATYADVVAPNQRAVIPLGPGGRLGPETSLVRDAHAAGLLVHTWTFRPENVFLAADFRDGGPMDARNPNGSIAEIRRYLAAGIDGFFTDDPALGRAALDGTSA